MEFNDHYVIQPAADWWDRADYLAKTGGRPVEEGLVYNSESNTAWLTCQQLADLLQQEQVEL